MQHATICLAESPRPAADAPLPDRLLLLKDGDNPAGDGAVYRVDQRTYAALSAQIAAGVFDRLVIDFNHQSVKGHPNYTPDPRSHAGYGKLEAVPGEGVFLSAIEWTEEGKLHRADYPDLSPAILTAPDPDPDGAKSVRGLVSVAVCTNGMLADGPRCLSAEVPEEAGEEARQDGAPPKTPETPPEGEGASTQSGGSASNGSATPPGGEGASTRSGGSASNGSATPATPPQEVREALAALAAEVRSLKGTVETLAAGLERSRTATAGEEARQDGAPPKAPATPPEGEGASTQSGGSASNGSATPPEGEGASTQSGGSASNGSATPPEGEGASNGSGTPATPAALEALAAQVETDAKAAMVAQAVAQGKAVTLAESVLAKMTREETAAYLSALPRTLPVTSALPRSNREAPAGVSIGARQAACVAEVRRAHPGWRYEAAWDEAERLHPELFRRQAAPL